MKTNKTDFNFIFFIYIKFNNIDYFPTNKKNHLNKIGYN